MARLVNLILVYDLGGSERVNQAASESARAEALRFLELDHR